MRPSLVWGGGEVQVACAVCGHEGVGRVRVTVTPTVVGDLEVRQCAVCASLALVDEPLVFAGDDGAIDDYVEVGAGLGTMLGALAAVDPRRVRRYLDVGCGYGFTVDMAARLWGWEASGVEPEPSGRRGAVELGVPIAEHLPAPDPDPMSGFDLVFASEVLEHVTDPVPFLSSLRSLLAGGGLLLLTTPAAEVVDPASSPQHIVPALAPGYHVFVASEAGLALLLARAGFDDVRVVRVGATLYAAAGGLDLLVGGADGPGPVPDDALGSALQQRYLDARRVQPGDVSALASALTTRRLRSVVAAGAWSEVPVALAEAADVLAHRHGVVLGGPALPSGALAGGGRRPPLTLAPIAFAAGMWALVDGRPAEACGLFDLAVAAARQLEQEGVALLEFTDLVRVGAQYAALAAARFNPEDAAVRVLALEDPDGRWCARVFTELVTAGDAGRVDADLLGQVVARVTAGAGTLSTDEDPGAAKIGVDALYALGIEALRTGDPAAALGWFQRCRDAALHGAAAGVTAHLVDVADEHLRLARRELTVARPGAASHPVVTSPASPPVVTHHLQSYWCDASGTYLDGWVASPDGAVDVVGLRLGSALHAPLDRLPPGLDPGDGRRTPFAVLATGSPHAQVSLLVRVVAERPDGEPPSVRDLEIPLGLPGHGLPPRSPDGLDSLSVERWIEELVAPWFERAPDGPVLAVGMRESPGADEPLARRLFGGREVVSVDIHPGPGVSLVADVHDLSSVIEPESFAIVYSVSVLEHLRLPWVAAAQMARALCVGGLALQGAPWVFPTHSAPNDFWRMSTGALTTLFGPEMGFEILEASDGAAVTVVPEPSWRAVQPLNLHMPTLASPSMSWVVARKVAATPETLWPLDPGTSRRVAEAYPIDGVIPFDTQGSGTA